MPWVENDDPRAAARRAAMKFAEQDFSSDPPASFRSGAAYAFLKVRVKAHRGTFDVHVRVEAVPEFHAEVAIQVEAE
jgi:hypothetical protein